MCSRKFQPPGKSSGMCTSGGQKAMQPGITRHATWSAKYKSIRTARVTLIWPKNERKGLILSRVKINHYGTDVGQQSGDWSRSIRGSCERGRYNITDDTILSYKRIDHYYTLLWIKTCRLKSVCACVWGGGYTNLVYPNIINKINVGLYITTVQLLYNRQSGLGHN